jgi:hypothetical protein
MIKLLLSILVLMVAFSGCKPPQKTVTGTPSGKYYEDLSGARPKIEAVSAEESTSSSTSQRDIKAYIEPVYAVNKQLDAVLDSINRINLTRKFIDGYTIQVYSGQKREEALTVKKDLLKYLPKIEADVHYNQPNFRVKAGRYTNQLEAQKDFQAIRNYFPTAIIVPDRIPLN